MWIVENVEFMQIFDKRMCAFECIWVPYYQYERKINALTMGNLTLCGWRFGNAEHLIQSSHYACRNEETILQDSLASESLENLEEMFPCYW